MEILSTKGGVFYHGGLKHLIWVKLGKLLVCVDHPERTSLLQAGDHNGTYSSFWAHSCFVDGFCKENHLPSHEECCKKCIEQIFGINHKQKVVRACGADDVLPSSLGEINLARDYFDKADKMLSPINLTSNFTKQSKEDIPCSGMKCSSWDVLHPSFMCTAPPAYPTTYDKSDGSPRPPIGCDISPQQGNTDAEFTELSNKQCHTQHSKQKLPTIRLSVSWLKQALIFAHHNMKTNPPGSRPNKWYWTKANLIAYLHTCSCSGKLIDAVYQSARKKEEHPPFPATWADCDAFTKCHYVPMHMV